MNARADVILVAEDEENDRFILQLAFERGKLGHALMTVCDGEECVDYLSGVGAFADRTRYPLPALLLLDLKMPRMHGFEVLTWLATKPEFNYLPKVVFSSSSDESDLQKARELGSCEYFVKPNALEDLVEILHRLERRWLLSASVTPPSVEAGAGPSSAPGVEK